MHVFSLYVHVHTNTNTYLYLLAHIKLKICTHRPIFTRIHTCKHNTLLQLDKQ